MKDMDKYWKSVGSLFDSKDNRKVIWIGYAVGLPDFDKTCTR